jgi:hypothetical protein
MSVDFREEVKIEKGDLLDYACDMHGAAETFEDMARLLHAIHRETIKPCQVIAAARLMQCQAETWSNLLGITQEGIESIVGRKVLDDL